MRDINADRTKTSVDNFCQICNLKHSIKVPTCHKNPDNPSTIDLMLTNMHRSFQNSSAIERGLSDFHKMTMTILNTNFKKQDPEIINNWDCKNVSKENCRQIILDEFPRMQCSHESTSLKQLFECFQKSI